MRFEASPENPQQNTNFNVVGYKTDATREGTFTQITPVFTTVTNTTNITLADLAFTPERDDNIQLFDENGDIADTLTYSRKKVGGDYVFYWKSDLEGEISNYTFPRGSSLWLNTANATSLTQSGAVPGVDTVITLPEGTFAQTGNCMPTDIKLSDLVFSDISRDDNIQMFDENGDIEDTLTYSRKKVGGDYVFYWKSDIEGELDADTYIFPAGKAFWVNCANGGTLTIPSPINK